VFAPFYNPEGSLAGLRVDFKPGTSGVSVGLTMDCYDEDLAHGAVTRTP
jgi:hypothetical protein